MSTQQPSASHVKSRLGWIDYARGFAIIFVVYRHMFEGLKNTKILQEVGINIGSYLILEKINIFLFSFRMPLFFIVSGLFIHSSLVKKGLNVLIENRLRTILYPYFVWGIIQIAIGVLFSAYTNTEKSFSEIAYLFYSPRNVGQFWYLYSLFNVAVLFAYLKVKLKLQAMHQLAIGLIFFFLSTFFSQNHIDLGFISDILHYYFFLALGDAISQSMLKGRLHEFFFSHKAAGLLLLPFLVSQYYFLSVNLEHSAESPKYLFVEHYQPFIFLIIALTGCAFVISLSSLLDKYKVANWLRYLGVHSLYIYVMHVIVFAAVRVFMTKVLHIYDVYLLMLVCITAGLIIPVLFYRLTQRMGLRYLFSLEKNTKPDDIVSGTTSTILQPTYERQKNNKLNVT